MTPIKGVSTQATIGSIRAKVDGSLGFSLSTPELTADEKVAFMALQNSLLEATFSPIDDPEAETISVKARKDEKTPSQRLRNAIYALWSTKKEAGEYVEDIFQTYYDKIMESFITKVKEQLESYE